MLRARYRKVTICARVQMPSSMKELSPVPAVIRPVNRFLIVAALRHIHECVGRGSTGGSGGGGVTKYAVAVSPADNGKVTPDKTSAAKGSVVTITAMANDGYALDTIKATDKAGKEIKLTEKNGKYTFTMPGGKVEVKATFVKAGETSPFVDVPADSYYFDAVKWAQKLGITNGKTDALFGANDPCTRGQIVTFLWRAAGSPSPKGTATVPADVLPGSYCYDAVAWAIENGVTNGFADGSFGVNSTCTRGQSVTFLYRALGTDPTTVNGFTDVAAGDFYAEAVAWAVENGITLGTGDGTFSPNATCTRAQSVTFLYRALGTAPTTVNGFTDVTADAFYADAVAWAVESGVTNGTSASTFSPNNGCTRAQIVTFLYRTMK